MAISFIDGISEAAATLTSMPTHQANDVILIFAYREGNNNQPAIPGDYTDLSSGETGVNTNSGRLGYKIAASGAETSGTWTNADALVCLVYRGIATADPIGDTTRTDGVGTTVTYGALTMQVGDGTSWVVGVAGHRATNTALETPPNGMSLRETLQTGIAEAAGHDTNGGVASWSQEDVVVNGTSTGWLTWTIELLADGAAVPAVRSSTGMLLGVTGTR